MVSAKREGEEVHFHLDQLAECMINKQVQLYALEALTQEGLVSEETEESKEDNKSKEEEEEKDKEEKRGFESLCQLMKNFLGG